MVWVDCGLWSALRTLEWVTLIGSRHGMVGYLTEWRRVATLSTKCCCFCPKSRKRNHLKSHIYLLITASLTYQHHFSNWWFRQLDITSFRPSRAGWMVTPSQACEEKFMASDHLHQKSCKQVQPPAWKETMSVLSNPPSPKSTFLTTVAYTKKLEVAYDKKFCAAKIVASTRYRGTLNWKTSSVKKWGFSTMVWSSRFVLP